MSLLVPVWEQPKPTPQEALAMCSRVELARIDITSAALAEVLKSLRRSHSNGGALFAAFQVGESQVFDWFASRNRLAEFGILTSLLSRQEVRQALPELQIPVQALSTDSSECSIATTSGFKMESSFLFDGRLAQSLYSGGAYGAPADTTAPRLDAREAKQLALAVCEDLFEQRFSEVSMFNNYDPWTPWFGGIAWDWTAFIFDRRKRRFSILALTDTD